MAKGLPHRLWQWWNGDFNFDRWFAHRAKLEKAKSPLAKLWHRHYLMKMNNRYAAFIPPTLHIPRSTVFPHGISGVFLSVNCVLGENCVIFQQVTLGSNTLEGSKRQGSPILEDNVFVGAGVRIIGKVTIGAHSRIAAGTALSTDVPPNTTVYPPRPTMRTDEDLRVNTFRTPSIPPLAPRETPADPQPAPAVTPAQPSPHPGVTPAQPPLSGAENREV